jgi:hypothetical protein
VFSNGATVAESHEDDPASRFNANDFNIYDGIDEGRCITTAWPMNDGRFWDVDSSVFDAASDTALNCSSSVEDFNSSFFEDFNLDFVDKKNRVMEERNEQSLLRSGLLTKMCNEHVSPIRVDTKRQTIAAWLTAIIGQTFETNARDCRCLGVDQKAPHQGSIATWSRVLQ